VGIVRKAFTLVEILIVVVILGIIAAIVIPRFSNATATARASMLGDDLRVTRMQIEVFKAQHCGVAPGYPQCDRAQTPTEDAFVQYMIGCSDSGGTFDPVGGKKFGPYLREMPVNPVNGKSTVLVLADAADFPTEASDTYGWIYQPATVKFKADSAGADEDGKAFIDY
jgi:prepilin-type N-terminal cleavage/methylation domain-containing protein